mgnify:CR=1 FL=1
MNETYKSEILGTEFKLVYRPNKNGKLMPYVEFECTRCFGTGIYTDYHGTCYKCWGDKVEYRALTTVKKWENQQIQADKEHEEYLKYAEYLVLLPARPTSEELENYRKAKITPLENGVQEITGVVTNKYIAETPYGHQKKLVLDVNGNTLWVNVTKALEGVKKEDTITIELDVNMFNVDDRKGSGKAGRRKLINHIKA